MVTVEPFVVVLYVVDEVRTLGNLGRLKVNLRQDFFTKKKRIMVNRI